MPKNREGEKLTKVIIYRHGEEDLLRTAGVDGGDCLLAQGWDDLCSLLGGVESADLVILDSVPSNSRPELTRRIKMIKDIPVVFFERTGPAPSGAGAVYADRGPPAMMPEPAPQTQLEIQPADPLELSRRFIDDNFKGPLSLKSIAQVAQISPSYFCRKFKARFGISPIAYLRNLRINRACHLLQNTNLPLSEITLQSGFFSVPYFCREFRKIKGISPIQFRRGSARK